MNKEVIELIIEKKPDLKGMREKLEAMQPGAYCLHRSWGFGQIQSYDEASGKLIIDFEEGKQGHAMDPVFCVDKLDVLPEGNLLVRHRTEPEVIEKLAKEQPADLIVEILSHCTDNSATASEIERLLTRLLGPIKGKKWWTSTKKLLVKDPRIAVPSKKTAPYFLRDEPLLPEQEILEAFYINKNPKQKILLAEKLYQLSSSVEEIEEDLPKILEALTEAILKAGDQLTQADRLHGCWVRNDLARHLHEDVEQLNPTSTSLILETEDLSLLVEELPSSYYKRFLDLSTRVFPDEWQTVVIQLLKNSTGKFTGECITFLMDRDAEELIAESLQRWLEEQTIKGPVLHWVVKNRNTRRFQHLVQDLLEPRLLKAIFYAIDYDALHVAGNRRIPLAEYISDDQELIPELLKEATEETTHDLAQTLILNQGFEDLTKRSLLARFIKRYSSVQSLISGEVADKGNEQDEPLFVSKESFELRKEEYETLIHKKIPENKEAIAIAREHGDLRENSEYKMARQDQDTLLARKAELEEEMERARVTDFKEAPTDNVGVGSIVEVLEGSTGKVHCFSILGAWDSKPEANIISYKAPLGQILLFKKVGDEAKSTIDGHEETWTIRAISRWVDKKA
tara:strand:- start:7294 stop:9165 length:1872 start_codon:yes stop_codon:yes gene_type:complete